MPSGLYLHHQNVQPPANGASSSACIHSVYIWNADITSKRLNLIYPTSSKLISYLEHSASINRQCRYPWITFPCAPINRVSCYSLSPLEQLRPRDITTTVNLTLTQVLHGNQSRRPWQRTPPPPPRAHLFSLCSSISTAPVCLRHPPTLVVPLL
jgi:hypothetical protein